MCVFRMKNHVTYVAGLPSGASSKVTFFAIFFARFMDSVKYLY